MNRKEDGLRRKLAKLYNTNVPTGSPSIPLGEFVGNLDIDDNMPLSIDVEQSSKQQQPSFLSDLDCGCPGCASDNTKRERICAIFGDDTQRRDDERAERAERRQMCEKERMSDLLLEKNAGSEKKRALNVRTTGTRNSYKRWPCLWFQKKYSLELNVIN
eukprot:IDg19991t1